MSAGEIANELLQWLLLLCLFVNVFDLRRRADRNRADLKRRGDEYR